MSCSPLSRALPASRVRARRSAPLLPAAPIARKPRECTAAAPPSAIHVPSALSPVSCAPAAGPHHPQSKGSSTVGFQHHRAQHKNFVHTSAPPQYCGSPRRTAASRPANWLFPRSATAPNLALPPAPAPKYRDTARTLPPTSRPLSPVHSKSEHPPGCHPGAAAWFPTPLSCPWTALLESIASPKCGPAERSIRPIAAPTPLPDEIQKCG